MSVFPTNTHNIKRAVKKSNHCAITKRGETSRSLYTIKDSTITANDNVIARQIERKKKHRECEGIVRNKSKGKVMIDYVIKTNYHHESHHNKEDKITYQRDHNHATDILSAKDKKYKTVLISNEIETYHCNVDNNLPTSLSIYQ